MYQPDAERLRVAGDLRTALDAYRPRVAEGLHRRYGGLDDAESEADRGGRRRPKNST